MAHSSRVVVGLALRNRSIVTIGTSTDDAGVIHLGPSKGHRTAVARFAGCDIGGWPGFLPIAVVPLWHDAQPDVMPACEKDAPENVTVLLWQLSHADDVATCPGGLPIAVVPLWHDAQPDVMPACEKDAPENVTVLLWQVARRAARRDARMREGRFPRMSPCSCGRSRTRMTSRHARQLPIAVVPLWHDAQPDVMPACEKDAPENVTVLLWQVSRADDVATCPGGLPIAVVPLWHDAQPSMIPGIREGRSRMSPCSCGRSRTRMTSRHAPAACPSPWCRCGTTRSQT